MKIERFRNERGGILNRAADKNQRYLFLHCANGMEAVRTKFFNENVKPMLFSHGIMHIEFVDNT